VKKVRSTLLLFLCTVLSFHCTSDASQAVDQLNLSVRSPDLGASDVANDITLSFSLDKQEPGRFGVVQGFRHTAGAPIEDFVFQGVDAQNFETTQGVLWPGPGTHVHLVAVGPEGQVLVDPLLEYDLVSLDVPSQDAGSATSDGSGSDGQDGDVPSND